jgi:glycerate-2-kinase
VSGHGELARLERIFRAGVAAADPDPALRAVLAVDGGDARIDGEALGPGERLHLLAVGKAASGMAAAALSQAGARVVRGLVVTKDGHARPDLSVRQLETAHPVPDERSAAAGREALAFVASVPPGDALLVLLSGGASSLVSCPAAGLAPGDLAETTRLLLGSGAAIDELNAVRKHLSATAGGRLALASRAGRSFVLALSDVAGDRIDVIGSGPFAADPTRWEDAIAVLRERGVWSKLPPAVRDVLEAGGRGELPDTPEAGAPQLARVRHRILASNRTALTAARDAARAEGLRPVAVWEELSGEARGVGRRLGTLLLALRSDRPVCLLAGGETTVTLRGSGLGGRSQELALAAALAFQGRAGVALLAAGTDGSDGPTDAAGACADGGTVERGRARGESAAARLEDNDSYRFFAAEGGLLRTGPTGTNVRDLVLASAMPTSG